MSDLSETQARDPQTSELLAHTASIVAAYVAKQDVPQSAIPDLIATVYDSLQKAAYQSGETDNTPRPEPAVPIEDSLTDKVLICLEDGLPFQSLKRHLRVKYNLTPEAYRKKWGLPPDYPMVAPDYAKRRSALAKRTGLGKKRR